MSIFRKKNKQKKDIKTDVIKPNANKSSRPVFGVELKEALQNDLSFDGIPIPAVVRYSIDYVIEKGTEEEGIYRISPNKSRLDELEALVNSCEQNRVPKFLDAHEAAGLLKRFLRQLPEHILTTALRPAFEAAASKCKCDATECCKCSSIDALKDLLEKLPQENYYLLGYVFQHAQLIIQKQSTNKMGLAALGILLQAMLILSRNEVRIFLLNSTSGLQNNDSNQQVSKLFCNINFKPYLKPKTLKELRKNFPDNFDDLKCELDKQKLLFDYFCKQYINYLNNSNSFKDEMKINEEKINECQSAIVMLRKKLKSFGFIDEKKLYELDGENKTFFNCEFIKSENVYNISENGNMSSVLLEKQLLALHSLLKEEIADEKRKITKLLSRLREIYEQLPLEEKQKLNILRQEKKNNEQNASTITDECNPSNSSESEILCEEEKKKRDDLVLEITRLRNLCAELRTHLEHDTVLLNNLLLKSQNQLENVAETNDQTTNLSNNLILKNGQQEIQSSKPLSHVKPALNDQSIQLTVNTDKPVSSSSKKSDENTVLITKL